MLFICYLSVIVNNKQALFGWLACITIDTVRLSLNLGLISGSAEWQIKGLLVQ